MSLNRVSLYSFPLSYNLPEGFSFRSLRYMIFYFLKELFASPSRFRLYFFTSCVVIKLSFFVRLNRSGFSFCYSLTFARFLFFCYSLTFVNFLFVFPAFSLRVSAFSFLRFGSAKVETFFYFPKLFFLFFILKF